MEFFCFVWYRAPHIQQHYILHDLLRLRPQMLGVSMGRWADGPICDPNTATSWESLSSLTCWFITIESDDVLIFYVSLAETCHDQQVPDLKETSAQNFLPSRAPKCAQCTECTALVWGNICFPRLLDFPNKNIWTTCSLPVSELLENDEQHIFTVSEFFSQLFPCVKIGDFWGDPSGQLGCCQGAVGQNPGSSRASRVISFGKRTRISFGTPKSSDYSLIL